MTTHSVSNVSPATPVAATHPSHQTYTKPASKPAEAPEDTVHLSAAAKKAIADPDHDGD